MIDIERVIAEAMKADDNWTTVEFHVPVEVADGFEEACREARLPKDRVIEAFMRLFMNHTCARMGGW